MLKLLMMMKHQVNMAREAPTPNSVAKKEAHRKKASER
jgi:hypothetical protein